MHLLKILLIPKSKIVLNDTLSVKNPNSSELTTLSSFIISPDIILRTKICLCIYDYIAIERSFKNKNKVNVLFLKLAFVTQRWIIDIFPCP